MASPLKEDYRRYGDPAKRKAAGDAMAALISKAFTREQGISIDPESAQIASDAIKQAASERTARAEQKNNPVSKKP